MSRFVCDESHVREFEEKGYLHVPGMFDEEEIGLLRDIARADQEKLESSRDANDASGRPSKIWLSSEYREDVYNAFIRCPRMAGTMDRLLNDEAYLYHYKMTLKEPEVGGAWEWHQDYGYWYNNNALFPWMASCMVAVDPATKENGCLQVIAGSHKCGRIDHGKSGKQTGADPDRVERILQYQEHVYAEMAPGDALFFHGNTLHRSDANTSPNPRWVLLGCFNARSNPCDDKPGHPSYSPMERWSDDAIKSVGRAQREALVG